MTTHPSLSDLGWGPFYQSQLSLEEFETLKPVRVTEVWRDAVRSLSPDGEMRLGRTALLTDENVTVGDWLLVRSDDLPVRLLERKTLLTRRAAGDDPVAQTIAANLDTLFVTSSCNADFKIARIERYLALAAQAGVEPVVLLTKADLADAPDTYLDRAREALREVEVLAVDATDAATVDSLSPWTGAGRTIALAGTSGVGKSTLVNLLTGAGQDTQGIREGDARGRHTTTSRSMHRIAGGGWIIDTPGMRALRLLDVADGVDAVFSDIADLAEACRFSNCTHDTEPGCAIRAAIATGQIDEDRLHRWQKLQREDQYNSETLAERHARTRKREKLYAAGKARMAEKQRGLK